MKEYSFKISGMACGGCENRVKTALTEIDGVENVEANHISGMVVVKSTKDLDISKLKEKVEDIGFEVVKD